MTDSPNSTNSPPTPPTPHEAAGPRLVGDISSFPSYAELTRTLVEGGSVAALATLTHDGHPYNSIAPISIDEHGAPIICVSQLAEHTRNLQRNAAASVLVCAAPNGRDPLAAPRATYVGEFEVFEPTDAQIAAHLAAHPLAEAYIGFDDFCWWRLEIQHLRYVGGFGVMGWAAPDDLRLAEPDPIIPAAGPMIEHLNDDHAEHCRMIVRHLAGLDEAVDVDVTALDRYGVTFDVYRDRSDHVDAVARVAFPERLDAPEQVRGATVELVARARELDSARTVPPSHPIEPSPTLAREHP